MKLTFSDLLKSGGLAKEKSIGWDQIEKYLSRARKDLQTGRKIIAIDEAVAMDLVYKAMFHAANALVRSYGFRPGRIGQHKAMVTASGRILGEKAEIYILRFDKLRQKRNYFEYCAGFLSSRQEIENSLKEVKGFINLVENQLHDRNPQKKLFK